MTPVSELELRLEPQRLAVFGGIYSNHLALRAAIDDARRRGAAALFCLGDLGAFGPHPDLVYPLLREGEVITMAGNYDDSLARGLDDCQCGYTDPRDNFFARLSYRYTVANTSAENRRWLRHLPHRIRIGWAGRSLLLCPGSPRRLNEFLWESTTPDHFLEKLFRDSAADAILATHTGIKWSRTVGDRTFINVGVLGRPENDGATNVWYALIDLLPGGRLQHELVPLRYDHVELAKEMRAERLPEEFISTIESGWWTTCLEILPARERARGRH
jgi:diadenosine tetraphosphatase ApaH/serine/threonine PP2A family protein phosphatase